MNPTRFYTYATEWRQADDEEWDEFTIEKKKTFATYSTALRNAKTILKQNPNLDRVYLGREEYDQHWNEYFQPEDCHEMILERNSNDEIQIAYEGWKINYPTSV